MFCSLCFNWNIIESAEHIIITIMYDTNELSTVVFVVLSSS